MFRGKRLQYSRKGLFKRWRLLINEIRSLRRILMKTVRRMSESFEGRDQSASGRQCALAAAGKLQSERHSYMHAPLSACLGLSLSPNAATRISKQTQDPQLQVTFSSFAMNSSWCHSLSQALTSSSPPHGNKHTSQRHFSVRTLFNDSPQRQCPIRSTHQPLIQPSHHPSRSTRPFSP